MDLRIRVQSLGSRVKDLCQSWCRFLATEVCSSTPGFAKLQKKRPVWVQSALRVWLASLSLLPCRKSIMSSLHGSVSADRFLCSTAASGRCCRSRCSLRSFLALLPWIAQRSSTLNPKSHIQGRKARRQRRAKALWLLLLGGSPS